MILTDKCKTDFGIWHFGRSTLLEEYKNFYFLSDTCKNALMVEFFDGVGLKIIIIPSMFVDNWGCDIFGWTECLFENLETRQEATNKAIEKANEIYNKL